MRNSKQQRCLQRSQFEPGQHMPLLHVISISAMRSHTMSSFKRRTKIWRSFRFGRGIYSVFWSHEWDTFHLEADISAMILRWLKLIHLLMIWFRFIWLDSQRTSTVAIAIWLAMRIRSHFYDFLPMYCWCLLSSVGLCQMQDKRQHPIPAENWLRTLLLWECFFESKALFSYFHQIHLRIH